MTNSTGSIKVLITGAAGQIAYSLIPLIASGQTFGPDQHVQIVLLDIPPAAKTLSGVVMEIEDCAYPLVDSIVSSTDASTAFVGVNIAILVGGFPRGPGMERKDLMAKNKPIFIAMGEALNQHADPNCRVLVVANPANTNCLIAAKHAPKIPKENFTALTRLDMNRAAAQLASKLQCSSNNVKNVVIWGNHSKTQVPDGSQAYLIDTVSSKKQSARSVVNNDAWLFGDFMKTVQNRGADVIAARGLSSAMSAANAIKDHLLSWLRGTPPGEFVSMGVYIDKPIYGVATDLIYSLPVTCESGGRYKVVDGLTIPDQIKQGLKLTEKELIEEKGEAGL
jgi:malate dehydrogenase